MSGVRVSYHPPFLILSATSSHRILFEAAFVLMLECGADRLKHVADIFIHLSHKTRLTQANPQPNKPLLSERL